MKMIVFLYIPVAFTLHFINMVELLIFYTRLVIRAVVCLANRQLNSRTGTASRTANAIQINQSFRPCLIQSFVGIPLHTEQYAHFHRHMYARISYFLRRYLAIGY